MTETDEEFLERTKTTKGVPTEQDAERIRRLSRDESLNRIVKKTGGGDDNK
jgi:hypothetical protein